MRRFLLLALAVGGLTAVQHSRAQGESPAESEPGIEAVAVAEDLVIPDVVRGTFVGDLPAIDERGVLRAVVSFSRTDFFLAGARTRGIMKELLDQYEERLNAGRKRRERRIAIKYVPVTFGRLIPALLEGEGDVAVGNLTVTPDRQKRVDFAVDPRGRIDELLVTHKDVQGIESLEDLSGRTVYVLRASSYAEHLRAHSARLQATGKPPINIREAESHLVTEDLLELVNAGVVEMTVADDYRARLWVQVLPSIVVREDVKVNVGGMVGWAVRKDNPKLLESLNEFAKSVRKGSLLGNVLIKRYYGNTRWIKNPLVEAERKKFEQLIALFVKYGDKYDFDSLAIVAQAYQESKLDHSAKSRAGAIGIMQLLPSTAKDANVAIPDIHELEQNIHAGTKYMAFLRDRYYSGPEFDDENRFAFCWAAYNAGPARVSRMRRKAKEMGLDPNQWFGHVEHAALAMVGQETARYVSNIFKYYITYKLIGDMEDERFRQIESLTGDGGG